MIIVKKSGLRFKNFEFRCALGKNGIKKKKKEGDNITPKGIFKINKLYYRSDKIKRLTTKIKKIKIKKNMAWCDDIKSPDYNKEIKLPYKFRYEKLYRNDRIYDLVIVINYNTNPVIKNKGSAIFIHIKKKNYQPTRGCIGLKKEHLLTVLENIKNNEKIKII